MIRRIAMITLVACFSVSMSCFNSRDDSRYAGASAVSPDNKWEAVLISSYNKKIESQFAIIELWSTDRPKYGNKPIASFVYPQRFNGERNMCHVEWSPQSNEFSIYYLNLSGSKAIPKELMKLGIEKLKLEDYHVQEHERVFTYNIIDKTFSLAMRTAPNAPKQ